MFKNQIQAVEYALNGERIISCGTNILKVRGSTQVMFSQLLPATVVDSSVGLCTSKDVSRIEYDQQGHHKMLTRLLFMVIGLGLCIRDMSAHNGAHGQ